MAITAGQTLTTGGGNATGSYAGAINANGTGVLAKIGTGTQTLTGSMTGGGLQAIGGTLTFGAVGGTSTFTSTGLTSAAFGNVGTSNLRAIDIAAGTVFNNNGTVTITTAGSDVVQLRGGTLVNTGTLQGPLLPESGVFSPSGGGTITNTGTISGSYGVYASAGTSNFTVTGNGSIIGTNAIGLHADTTSGNIILGTTAVGGALGTVTGNGNNNAIDAAATGIGTISIVAGGTVSLASGTGRGISATQSGTGTISIDGAGSVAGSGQAGIYARQTGAGPTAGAAIIVAGSGAASGTVGIDAAITGTGNVGNILVTRSGAVTATSTGINATTAGTGTVTVSAGAITTTNGSGIVATGTTGAVAVTANGAITAACAGNAGLFLTGNSASNTATVAANTTVQGAIGLRVAGTGTTGLSNSGTIASTAAAGANANAVQIDGGTLVIGNTAGTPTGNIAIVNAAAGGGNGASVLTVARTSDLTLTNTVTGAGTLNQNGSGQLNLTGVNSAANGLFTGTANVNAGILAVNGTLGNTAAVGAVAANSAVVNVNTGGTLHGSGTIAGSVVMNGGTVSADNSPGTLTVAGNYTLNAASTSLFELGAPGFVGGASNDLINVGGNLALAGTLNLVAASNAATNPVSGAYRLYNYGGALTGGFGTVTTPTAGTSALVYTNIPNQVNVLLTNGNQSVQYFDGADTTGATAGPQGGTGAWNATSTNWTMLPGGQVNDVWRSGVGIFGTTAGTVTVAGAQNLQGLQFTVDGYQLAGTGTLNLTGDGMTPNQSFMNVDTNVGATIANALTSTGGTIGLVKLGAGTLTLSGASTYTGATTVQAGTLVIAGGGAITSNVSNNATFTNAGTVTGNLSNAGLAGNTGTITGTAANTGTLSNAGTIGGGLTNLAGTTTNTGTINGGAAILAGTFTTTGIVNGTLSNAATVNAQGQINGAVTNNAGASFVQTDALTGIGRLTNDGSIDLGGNSLVVGSLTGSTAAATIANGGTLSAGSDGTSSAYAGTIGGATALTKVGTGTLTLSGANGYTGATAINAGTLAAGAANAFSATSAVTIASGARMDLATFNQAIASLAGSGSVTLGSGILTTGGSNASTAYAGTISGSGGLIKVGTGTFTLSGANSYTGTTTVSAGTLANTGSLAGPVANAATFTNAGSVAGALANAGNATNTGSLSGGVANSGNLTTSGTIAGGLTNTGTVTASAGRIDGAIANNAGTFSVTGNVASNGTLTNAGGATVAVAGSGAYGIAGLLTNAGSLTVANGGSLTAPAGIVNSGSIQVAQGGTITDALANSGSVVNDGRYNADVSNAASGTIANRTTGVWTGNLTANTGSVSNSGLWQGNARNDAGGTLTNTGTWTTASAPVSNAGTLANTGTINGGVANSGTFGNAATLNGGLANSAGTSTNAGTINGAVAVTGGSLATSGTINGAVTNAAAITASGRIAGAVTNAAGASFVLAGPLTGVTGLTNNGTVDLGGTAFTVGSLSGSNGGAILRNGALTTNGDNSSTAYAGTIVDGGSATSLTKLGTGTLTLTGTNTYSGGTTVSAGTLVASAASLGSGGVTSNTTLVIDQASDATLGSALNGTGRFVKQGAGTLTYTGTGTGTLSGPTTVATGGFVVNGSLANTVVTVANAAVVGGTGTIGGLTVQSGASVAPGATTAAGSLGTLNVNGNVLFAAQSLYRVDATAAGQSDRIAGTGTATLQGGTVQVTAGTGAYAPSTRYTILTAAGGVAGRFAGVSSNFAFLTPFLAYDANDVYLRLARNDLAFGATAQTRNQANVAAAAQALGVGTPIYDAIAVLSAAQSRQAFNALSGEVYASAVTTMFEGASFVRETILDHLRFGESNGFAGGSGSIGQRFAPGSTLPGTYTADLPGRAPTLSAVPTQFVVPAYAVWGQAFGAFGNTAGNGNAAGLSRQTSGFVLGAETALSGLTGAGADLSAWRVGVAGGYSFTGFDVTGRLSSGTVESGYGAVYARGPVGPLQLRLGAAYADNGLTARRTAAFPGFSQSLSGKAGGETIQGFGEVGYRIGTATGYVEPFAGGAAIHIRRDGLTEQGGIAALTVAGRGYDIQTATAGIQGQLVLGDAFGENRPLVARGLVGYRRAFGDVVPSALLSFGVGGPSFIASGVPIDRDALVASAGLDWQVASAATIGLNYTGQVGPRAQDHGVKGNFNVRF
ncbi:autotransporter-associated beta strand repeat-containing protein [Methylobacterium sp. WL120]|uniref:autotransporter-associated beta strand repeat-containing protein n=1 Tax=Methylobacterium sp. WL120 TaxID=2603887 RepID=UPI0016504D68|nr:autotransporter-associated beta strand repeat-containing protein [Methylobacterium sp. WL120]